MNGKDKCRILKDIRRQIAEKNDIEWVVSECSHKGSCKGTCPKCESEVRKLERELSLRSRLGKAVAVTGVCAVCATGLSACTLDDVVDFGTEIIENIKDTIRSCTVDPEPVILDGEIAIDPEPYPLDGDVPYYPDTLSGYIDSISDYNLDYSSEHGADVLY